jgi:hypothetical protein
MEGINKFIHGTAPSQSSPPPIPSPTFSHIRPVYVHTHQKKPNNKLQLLFRGEGYDPMNKFWTILNALSGIFSYRPIVASWRRYNCVYRNKQTKLDFKVNV